MLDVDEEDYGCRSEHGKNLIVWRTELLETCSEGLFGVQFGLV